MNINLLNKQVSEFLRMCRHDLLEWPIVPLVIQELCLIGGKTCVAMVTDNSMLKQIKHCVAAMAVCSPTLVTTEQQKTSFSLPVNVPLVRLNYSFNCLP